MSAARPRRLEAEDRHAQLIALGVQFLADRPLDELSMEELSARAGVSRALVFHYFGSRQGLRREVVAVARDSLLVASAPRPELPPLARLHDTLLRIVEFVREHRGTFYSLVRGAASGDRDVRAVVDESRVENTRRLTEVFVELGEQDGPRLQVALRSWVAFAEEALVELAVEADTPPADVVAFLEASLRGVVEATRTGIGS